MWVASIQFPPLGLHHFGREWWNYHKYTAELWKAPTMWWFGKKTINEMYFYIFFFATTMVNDIINQLSWIGCVWGWMMWWDVESVFTFLQAESNPILRRQKMFPFLFWIAECLMIGWWMSKCTNNGLIDVKRVTCTTLLNYAYV